MSDNGNVGKFCTERMRMVPKDAVGELIDRHIKGEITYGELHRNVHDMGYSTTSLGDMVRLGNPE